MSLGHTQCRQQQETDRAVLTPRFNSVSDVCLASIKMMHVCLKWQQTLIRAHYNSNPDFVCVRHEKPACKDVLEGENCYNLAKL